ncbi:SDR family NAD(P)-dependent oxidoreductase [Streptomyces pinistramenti]|uniref:SDR family NAD(P)-dependent oxidoreductase n=1 Tax=Streptomyces pinistramenti TaxID=2884812 RepID=UPI001D06C770|nr:SDR family NAD(P)-dependent oxidoreductase [Streptomyces pinistramenti]MCB5911056.1 SDR family NAD(P)-dependent oxidoreductase [Streptomyces pinistramenti]
MNEHVLVTGGAGFIGTHLCSALLKRGARVTAVDSLTAGRLPALDDLQKHPRFTLIEHDITQPLDWSEPVTGVMHLASPIGPAHVRNHPVRTLQAGSSGTVNALEIARRYRARIVLASSAEVYGEPAVQPQPETYWGNVDPTGPMSGYAEAKRFLEAMAFAYRREYGVNTGIIRPFNVYGPGMLRGDRRVVAAFVEAALADGELTVQGNGVRSLCYIDDFVGALITMLDSDAPGPINLGAASGTSIADLAELVVETAGSGTVTVVPARHAEGTTRCPDITTARTVLGWAPTTSLADGIRATVEAMRATAPPARGATVEFDVPTAWLTLVPGAAKLRCEAATVGDALRWLTETHRVLAPRLLSPEGELVPWTNVFLGDTNVRDIDGLETALSDDVTLTVLPAMAGG